MDAVEDLLHETEGLLTVRRRLPGATYRLQLHAGFTFRDAARLAPYLRDLGITHCYASPYLKARAGSTHGYDIVDHSCLNPEIGSTEDFEAWVATLREHGLGQILDTVPNHMGVGTNENAWWNDILENGPASTYAGYFDIAWRASPRAELQDKVLLPVLGEPYGDALEKGEIRLVFEEGAFTVHYFDRRFPVAPSTYAQVLGHRVAALEQALGTDSPGLVEYQSILTAVRNLPDRTETDSERLAERRREKEVVKRRLTALAAESGAVRKFLEENVACFNGTPGDPRSFDLLDHLLEQQCYRLAYWRVAPDEINYRRFFDINDLAALNAERPEVFEATHGLILRLLAEGKIDGLRIDHPDGLYDPAEYFLRLQEYYTVALARTRFERDHRFHALNWPEVEGRLRERVRARLASGPEPAGWPLYVVVEKILGVDEPLVENWAVWGSSGYDFLNQVNGLFVDTTAARAFTRFYQERVQDDTSFAECVYRNKLLILQVSLSSELYMLTHQLDRLAQKSRRSRDFTFNTLRRGLREVIACFPVYRSYIAGGRVHDGDRRQVLTAIRRAAVRNPLLGRKLFRFIRDMLLLEYPESFTDPDRAEQRQFAGKFQQVTAPVMAKGVEDTAFYVYTRLVSLNEVGGEPDRFGIPPERLHAYLRDRQARWPYSLSGLSTHDTKRSEDVRARINVLSEMPDDWAVAVDRWSGLNAGLRPEIDGAPTPGPNEEYLLYQTLIGAWPLEPYSSEEYAAFVHRIQDYMLKALHEAKVHTSWINPNEEYDAAVGEFIARILDQAAGQRFLADFRPFQRRISHYGLYNSLSQTLLKIAAPGVPDTYQGTELWDFSLVDPDNRRPVDYERRRRLLGELRQAGGNRRELTRGLVASKDDGRIKLYTTWRALQCRRDHPELFTAGEYQPLIATGTRADHLFAFSRHARDCWAVVVVPRLLNRLVADGQPPLGTDVWQDTRLKLPQASPALRWHNVFTGEVLAATETEGRRSLSAADLFAHFPVVLLLGEPG